MQLMSDGSWQGGDLTNVIATDARNGTPISAVAYAMDYKATVGSSRIVLAARMLTCMTVAHLLPRQERCHQRKD